MSKVICLLGGSGAGKTTIETIIPLQKVITHTTRKPREWEFNGIHKYFHTDHQGDLFDRMDKIAAWTEYPKGSGNYYWTEKSQFLNFLNQWTPVLYVVDRRGVEMLQEAIGIDRVYSIWIDVEDSELERRMRKRGDSEDLIKERMENHREIKDYEKGICNVFVTDHSSSEFFESKQVIAGRVALEILDALYGRRD